MTADEQRAIWREKTRRWREANPEKNREVAKRAMAKYSAANRDRLLEAQRLRHAAGYVPHPRPRLTPEQRREHGLAYRASHPRPHDPEDRRRRYEANREQEATGARRYRGTHGDELRATQRAWRTANPEKYRALRRAAKRRYKLAHPDKWREQRRRNARAHPGKKREYKKRWRLADPERTQMYDRTKGLKRHGLTPEDYDAMYEAQGGLCAICQAPETRTTVDKVSGLPRVSALAVDHDHDTGAVRDLLCLRCNNLLGLLEPEPEIVTTMIAYLAHHSPKEPLTADT